jgi:hypothetical protein
MWARSTSVRPTWRARSASGAVSCRRQIRVSHEATNAEAMAASAEPAGPAAWKSASRWVASTWMVPWARDSRRSESTLATRAGTCNDRHSSSRMIIRAGPGSSIAAWPQEETQAKIIATVSSPRSATRDRSTAWIGAPKSGNTVVGPSNSPPRAPRTIPPSASVTGRIISRSSPAESPRTRSSRAMPVVGSRSTAQTLGIVGLAWQRAPPSAAWPAPAPSGRLVSPPEASSIASDTELSSVGVSALPSRVAASEHTRTSRRRWISASLSPSCAGSAGSRSPSGPASRGFSRPGSPGSELDRLGAQRPGQRRVLVLQVAGDERAHPVGHQPQRQGLDGGGLADAWLAGDDEVGVADQPGCQPRQRMAGERGPGQAVDSRPARSRPARSPPPSRPSRAPRGPASR